MVSYVKRRKKVEGEDPGSRFVPVSKDDPAFNGWLKSVKRGTQPIFTIAPKLRNAVEQELLSEYEDGSINEEGKNALIDYYLFQLRVGSKTMDSIPASVKEDVINIINMVTTDCESDDPVDRMHAFFDKYSVDGRNHDVKMFKTPHGFVKHILEEAEANSGSEE